MTLLQVLLTRARCASRRGRVKDGSVTTLLCFEKISGDWTLAMSSEQAAPQESTTAVRSQDDSGRRSSFFSATLDFGLWSGRESVRVSGTGRPAASGSPRGSLGAVIMSVLRRVRGYDGLGDIRQDSGARTGGSVLSHGEFMSDTCARGPTGATTSAPFEADE